jgi:hypothetical protein
MKLKTPHGKPSYKSRQKQPTADQVRTQTATTRQKPDLNSTKAVTMVQRPVNGAFDHKQTDGGMQSDVQLVQVGNGQAGGRACRCPGSHADLQHFISLTGIRQDSSFLRASMS